MNDTEIQNSKGTILVVDDTLANLQVLTQMLTEQGYKIRPAVSGKLAFSFMQSMLPDLILLDIQMPEMDGYEVCEKLKADDRTCDIPVIFISALSDVFDKVKAFSVGGVDYITKPFQAEEVLARVETHLKLNHLQQQLVLQNEELRKTLEHLKTTQEELIQSEKMAALGQLVAGIAHEINTPLGAINSAMSSVKNFLTHNLAQLPEFFHSLPKAQQPTFLALLQKSLEKEVMLSSKEERKLKRKLTRQLEADDVNDADTIADTLVEMGIYDDVEPFLSLLKHANSEEILDIAYKMSSLQRSSQTIDTAVQRASKVVFALKNFAHYDHSGEKTKANITDGIETVLTLYQSQFKHKIEIIKHYASLPLILCYPDELNQVWTNLIHNALQAMEYQGTLTIDVKLQDNQVLVSIIDNGKGITKEINDKIFEPFFTTKRAGEGNGLGLDIVKKIVEKHEGDIKFDSQQGKTTFTVSFPI
ncbi:response regulator [Candidatus Parabeggiatoa sp. HSG14]|uniref:sensor histidine kinase n=1 Tax=Candidatus Parabeggiatoa sp. HSG14 TaxID=3055593 RepID=UPI0025A79DFF|nr:response regulator [Thiotrichales bacterium HSG14]